MNPSSGMQWDAEYRNMLVEEKYIDSGINNVVINTKAYKAVIKLRIS
jgi:hypothetical protein